MDKNIIDAASGGALVDKTPTATRNLIANMADNSQQFNTRASNNRVFHLQMPQLAVVPTTSSELLLVNRIDELTSLVRQLDVTQHQTLASKSIRSCGICFDPAHSTDTCLTM